MSKPVNLTQSVGPHYFQCLYMESEVASTAKAANNSDLIMPATAIYNANNQLMANKYATGGSFYFNSTRDRHSNQYLQIVTEGGLIFWTEMSIDGVVWATAGPTGAPTGGSPTAPINVLVPIPNAPIGMNYKISTDSVSGNYYINFLS